MIDPMASPGFLDTSARNIKNQHKLASYQVYMDSLMLSRYWLVTDKISSETEEGRLFQWLVHSSSQSSSGPSYSPSGSSDGDQEVSQDSLNAKLLGYHD
jgi:hypothetical protein